MNTCQFIVLSVIISASRAATTPWPGPFADHILGQVVEDTAEVAAAKRQHAEAHSQVRAILPELPLEEKFPDVHAPVIVPQHPVVVPHYVQQPVVATARPQFTPPSVPHIGQQEAAKTVLRKAITEAKALLEELNGAGNTNAIPPSVFAVNYVPVDTPEVAAAKLEHAKAYAALLGH